MDNSAIAASFHLLAELMELHDENPFKIKSYAQAARLFKNFNEPLAAMDLAQLEAIPGVGKAIAEKTLALVATGHLPLLEKYLEQTPSGVVEMLSVKGLGPKKLARLWRELGIESPGELYYACIENRLTLLSGFGEKTQENIRQSVAYLLEHSGMQLWARAEKKWLPLKATLVALGGVDLVMQETGAFRRKDPTINRLDVLVRANALPVAWTTLEEIQMISEQACIWKGQGMVPVHLQAVPEGEFEKALFESTAVQEHLAFVKSRMPSASYDQLKIEAEIYAAANLPVFPPEWRHEHPEFFGNPEQQQADLIAVQDIRGVVHTHTQYSDGSASIAELAQYCREHGFGYLVVSDHSRSAAYAGGLSTERVEVQHREIDMLNESMAPFKIFKSIESDILTDGSLDYEDDVLSRFDLVIASVHSQLNMDEERATTRLIKAIENPFTSILGHPTGRLLLSRKGYPLDFKKIIDACAANGVAIELNANPHRLDIDWTHIPYCMEQGVFVSINPDAHSLAGVGDIRHGVAAARRGGLSKASCLNALEADAFLSKVRRI